MFVFFSRHVATTNSHVVCIAEFFVSSFHIAYTPKLLRLLFKHEFKRDLNRILRNPNQQREFSNYQLSFNLEELFIKIQTKIC